MHDNPVTINSVPTVREIYDALSHGYKCYPVTNKAGQLIGNISANFLIVLIREEQWYNGPGGDAGPREVDKDKDIDDSQLAAFAPKPDNDTAGDSPGVAEDVFGGGYG